MKNSELDKHGFAAAPAGVPWTPDLASRGDVTLSRAEPLTATALPYSSDVHPQLRTDAINGVTISQAASLPAVYRCLAVLGTSAEQLPITVERNGETLRGRQVPGIIKRPNVDMDSSEFIKTITISLAATGNAYLHLQRADGDIVNIEVWNPHAVYWTKNQRDEVVYSHAGKTYPARDVRHITTFRLPGAPIGLGPIQAANPSLTLAVRQRDFAAGWFDTTGQPAGILTSDQVLTGKDAHAAINAWNHLDEAGNHIAHNANPSRIKVLGKGLHYEQLVISPKDALWLDAQNFSVLDVARLFGVPPNMLYAAIEGNSMTYSNVEQAWLEFVRFTLVQYVRPIEAALTDIAPLGQRVKLNYEGLLRPDTKGRYEAHATGIRNGFLTINEVREMEGRPPLSAEELAFYYANMKSETAR